VPLQENYSEVLPTPARLNKAVLHLHDRRRTCEAEQMTHSRYFYSASPSPLLLRGAPDNSIDALSELTCWSATGNYEWRTCPMSLLRGGKSGIRTCDFRTQGTEPTTELPRPTVTCV